jgi:hypothetical protein
MEQPLVDAKKPSLTKFREMFFQRARAGTALQVRAICGVLIVGLLELALFIDYLEHRYQTLLVASGKQSTFAAEGLVIRSDGLGYYAWLGSLLIDHDWSFDNEFDNHSVPGSYVPPRTYRTALGRRANQWSIGPACIWATTVGPGHFALSAVGNQGQGWPRDGYSLPYQLLVGVTTLLVSFIGLGLVFGICRQVAGTAEASLAASLVTLGTSIVYYNTIEGSMAHGIGTVFLASLVFFWIKTYGSLSPKRWLALGALVGATALMRWQLATFAILPLGEGILQCWREDSGRRDNTLWRTVFGLTLAALGASVAFIPQLIAWHYVYGAWLINPVPQVDAHWFSPSFWQVLASQDRSFFYWTPTTLLAFLGYISLLVTMKSPASSKEPMSLLFGAFLLQVYVLSSVWGAGPVLAETGNPGGVFLGNAFGFRHLTESVVVLAPGLAYLLRRGKRLLSWGLCALAYLLVVWNLLLLYQYCWCMLPSNAGASPGILLTNAYRVIRNDPVLCMPVFVVPGLICLVLNWRADHDPQAIAFRAKSRNCLKES